MQHGRIICDRVDRPENFVGGCHGKIEITGEDVTFAENVAKAMQQYYFFEAHRATKFREFLESYLGIPVRCQNNEKSKDDGSIISGMRGLLCMNLEVELKRGLGDAEMQNIAFTFTKRSLNDTPKNMKFQRCWWNWKACGWEYRLCLTSTGRLSMSICRLNFRWLHQTIYVKQCYCCTPNYVRITREVYADGHEKIIKFVEGRYGDTVQYFRASKGNSPPLLSCELITEATNTGDDQRQLKLLLDELRENNFVHGDLRPPNVFLHGSQEKVVLIDFDWAGVAGVDIYPYGMNPEISWPKGAHGGAKLDPAHDLEWLYRMFLSESKQVQSVGRDEWEVWHCEFFICKSAMLRSTSCVPWCHLYVCLKYKTKDCIEGNEDI
ncbi:putative protein kinase-like domain superfamily [Plasmopara halstedii]